MIRDPHPTLTDALGPIELAILRSLVARRDDADDDPDSATTWLPEGPARAARGEDDGDATTEWDRADERAVAERAGRRVDGRRRAR